MELIFKLLLLVNEFAFIVCFAGFVVDMVDLLICDCLLIYLVGLLGATVCLLDCLVWVLQALFAWLFTLFCCFGF